MFSITNSEHGRLKRFSTIFGLLALVFAISGCSDDEAEAAAKYDAYVFSAQSYISQGQFQAALIEASNAIQLSTDNQKAYQIMGQIYLKLGQPREAGEMLGQIQGPEEETLLLLVEANLDAGKLRSAGDALKLLAMPEADQARRLAARQAASQGNPDRARELYSQVLANNPDDSAATLGLARIHLGLGELAEAKVLLAENFSDANIRAESLYLRSTIASRQNELDSAEVFLNDAISSLPSTDIITPLKYSILVSMKDVLMAQGKSEEAMIFAGLLTEALPGAQQTTNLLQSALESIESGDLDSARSTLAEAREIAPTSPRAATLLATVDFLEGNNEAAALQLEQFIDAETSTHTELQIYAVTQLRLGNAEKVIERLGKDIDNIDNAKLMALYAVALNELNEFETAEGYFKRAIEIDPTDGRLHLAIAQIQLGKEAYTEALVELQLALEKSPSDPAVQRILIGLYLKLEMNDKADKLVAGLDASYPKSIATQLLVGAYYLRLPGAELAEEKFKQVLKLGESIVARNQLARIYMETKKFSAAEQQYRKIIALSPDEVDPYKGFITALELTERKELVVDELKKMFDASRSNTAVLILSEYLGRNGRLEQATEVFSQYDGDFTKEAIRLFESLTLASSRDLISKDKITDARDLLTRSIEKFASSERLLAALVTLDIKDQKYDAAALNIERLRAVSSRPIVEILAGDLSSAQGNFDAAKDTYLGVWRKTGGDQLGFKVFRALELANSEKSEILEFFGLWIEQAENANAVLMMRAGYSLAIEDRQEAQADYRLVLETDPENVAAQNNLAWAYGEAEPEKALVAGKRAYELAGDNAQILDTYGWFLFKNGRGSEGLVILKQATEMAPDDLEIRAHYEAASGE
ncbi:MAG: Tfp pilus assembly protein PilF [Litorivivens sp.]